MPAGKDRLISPAYRQLSPYACETSAAGDFASTTSRGKGPVCRRRSQGCSRFCAWTPSRYLSPISLPCCVCRLISAPGIPRASAEAKRLGSRRHPRWYSRLQRDSCGRDSHGVKLARSRSGCIKLRGAPGRTRSPRVPKTSADNLVFRTGSHWVHELVRGQPSGPRHGSLARQVSPSAWIAAAPTAAAPPAAGPPSAVAGPTIKPLSAFSAPFSVAVSSSLEPDRSPSSRVPLEGLSWCIFLVLQKFDHSHCLSDGDQARQHGTESSRIDTQDVSAQRDVCEDASLLHLGAHSSFHKRGSHAET